MPYQGLIEHYRRYLPVSPRTPVITLHEGHTPLIPVPFGRELGEGVQMWVKFEGANPTGSFKDRGMTMAISKAVEEGAKAVICASTGNTSASAAAYAARAGLDCYVVLPKGKIALGKLAQALVHGARVLAIEGNFDAALGLVRDLAAEGQVTLVNSVNPYRIEGQKTAAFEVCDELGDAPEYLAIPVGNAGNITAYWRGFSEYAASGLARRKPVVLGFQAEGAAPLVHGHPIASPETIATAIRIGNPASWSGAVDAVESSGGRFTAVTDAEILEAYARLAREAGVFCEPASAASVAGVLKLGRKGLIRRGTQVVCVLTGHGLKDPDRAVAVAPPLETVPADLASLRSIVTGAAP